MVQITFLEFLYHTMYKSLPFICLVSFSFCLTILLLFVHFQRFLTRWMACWCQFSFWPSLRPSPCQSPVKRLLSWIVSIPINQMKINIIQQHNTLKNPYTGCPNKFGIGSLNVIFWSSEVCIQRLRSFQKNVFYSKNLPFQPFLSTAKLKMEMKSNFLERNTNFF